MSELWCGISRCFPIEIVIWMTIFKWIFSNMWQELRTKQQLGYIVQLSLGHGYCLNMLNILNSAQRNIELRQRQESYDSLKGSNRRNQTVTPPQILIQTPVFSSHEQSNTATISSCLKSGFLLKLHKDELGREALSDTSSLSPAPSDGRQQTRIDTGSLYTAEWKISQRWVSKTWFFFTLELEGTYKYIIHTIHNLCIYYLDNFPVILWRVVFFLQIPIFEVQSEFDPTAVRAQIEACWKRQLQWLLEDSGYCIRCLDMMRDVKFLRFQEKRMQIGYCIYIIS